MRYTTVPVVAAPVIFTFLRWLLIDPWPVRLLPKGIWFFN